MSRKKTAAVVVVGIALAACLAIPAYMFLTPSGRYSRIQAGMFLSQVEAILGPGKEVPKTMLPIVGSSQTQGTRPIVEGDEFYEWTADRTGGPVIYIGLRNGRVCDKAIDSGDSF